MFSPDVGEPRGHSLIANLMPILVIGIGTSVIAGWTLDNAVLKSLFVGLTAMNPMTAIAFILSGLALWFMRNRQRILLAQLFSLMVVIIAVLVFGEIVFGWGIGIDGLLFADKLQAEIEPNRMAPNTALNFLLVGVALFLMSRDMVQWARVAQTLILVALFIAYFALIGYVYEATNFYGILTYIPMALNTALTFLILCMGTLLAQPDAGVMSLWRSHMAGGIVLRLLLPIVLLLPLIMGWLESEGVRISIFDSDLGEAVFTVANTILLVIVIWWASRFMDHSDRKRLQSEAALRESEARYRSLFDNSSDSIIILDEAGNYVDANEQAVRLTGYTHEELLTFGVGSLAPTPEEGLAEFRRLVDNGHTYNNMLLRRKDGSQVPIEFSASRVLQSPVLYQVITRDVSERKQAEESLRQSLVQERRLNELKSRFVAMVSHEFRTPLAVIRSSTDLLLHYGERATQEKRQDRLEKIQHEIGVMVQLLDDILFFRRAEDSGIAFNPELLDLSAFCVSLIAEIQPAMTSHQIEFSGSGDCTNISADPKLLRQAVTNLITNAVKYSPERPNIQLELICGEKEVILHVRDEGIGIPEEDQAKLFEVFHRASNVGSISGTGLGLPIIKQAVEAHGGSIVVASEENVGTTFTISLPRRAGIQPSLSGS